MNEIIAELYDQAIVIEDGGDYVCGELDPEKFAELIVKECSGVNYNSSFQDGEFHARELLEHFGVGEKELKVPAGYTAEELERDNPYNQWMGVSDE